jgi:hypothetical protein
MGVASLTVADLVSCMGVAWSTTDATAKLVEQLSCRFPSAGLMDALGIIYPQYWLDPNCDTNFERHIRILKEQYGTSKPFSTAAFPEGSVNPILSPANLDMQTSMFKNCMKEHAARMLNKPPDQNPVTRLWRSLDANSYLRHSLSEFIILAQLAIVMVLGLVQDEPTFSTVSFMKSKLRNRLSEHLELVVDFKSQKFFTLETFPYTAAYESWREETKRLCDTG